MTARVRLDSAALTGELPVVAVCACDDDVHRCSVPVVEHVDAVVLTRWRCTCGHCRCEGCTWSSIPPAPAAAHDLPDGT